MEKVKKPDYSKYRIVEIPKPKVIGKVELKEQPKRVITRKIYIYNHGDKCCYCDNDTANTREHIVPLSFSGNNKIENKTACCFQCNNMRGNLSLTEFENLIDIKIKPVNPEKAKTMLRNINRLRRYILGMNKKLLLTPIHRLKANEIINSVI